MLHAQWRRAKQILMYRLWFDPTVTRTHVLPHSRRARWPLHSWSSTSLTLTIRHTHTHTRMLYYACPFVCVICIPWFLMSLPVFCVGPCYSCFYRFLCCPIKCLYVLNVCCGVRNGFPHKNDVRFVFTYSCVQEGSCLIYVICVWLRIVVSNTYCVVFVSCFSSSCVPYVPNFGCPFDIPFTFIYCQALVH